MCTPLERGVERAVLSFGKFFAGFAIFLERTDDRIHQDDARMEIEHEM